jgi:hypothetical protein
MRGSPDTLSWHACLSRQGRSDRNHFAPLLTDLMGKQCCTPRSGYCANHQGKAGSRPPTSSTSGATGSSASPDPRPRPQPRPREKVSALPDPRPRPQLRPQEKVSASPDFRPQPQPREKVSASPDPRPRPQEKSPPRPTSSSDRLRYRGYIITLLLASCLRLWRNKTGVPSKVTPAIGNDGSLRAPMTSVALKPPTEASKHQQDPCRPTAVLLQGSRHFSDGHVSSCTGLKALPRQPRSA